MFAKKIRTQMLLIALIPLLLVIMSVSVFMLSESLNDIETRLEQRGNDISSQAVLMSEFYFYTGDTQQLSEIANVLANLEGVSYVRFLNSAKKMMAENISDSESVENSRLFIIPIYSKNVTVDEVSIMAGVDSRQEEQLGVIEIGLSKDGHGVLRAAAYWRILLVTVSAVVLGVIMVVLFGRRLSGSLSDTVNAARAVKLGEMSTRSPENGEGEILEFQQVFNKMVGTLQENEIQLQNRIEQATLSLNETVSELSAKNLELAQIRQETIELERSKAISDERGRIMKDMHDGIGGQLVASLAMIEKEKNSDVRENVSSALRECLDDFRLIILSLNVHESNLSALLADFKYRISKKLGKLDLELMWQVDEQIDEINIQPQQSLHLLRILQEMFTNVLKHANARTIQCKVSYKDSCVSIVVDDDGSCDLQVESNPGHGLNNMAWRAKELGGSFNISQNHLGGCRAELSFIS